MSTSQQALGDALRSLPTTARVWLYAVYGLIGTALAVAPQLGIADLGPVTLTQVLQVYAFLAPVMGSIAYANTKESDPYGGLAARAGYDPRDFRENVDLATFAPVGRAEEVYG